MPIPTTTLNYITLLQFRNLGDRDYTVPEAADYVVSSVVSSMRSDAVDGTFLVCKVSIPAPTSPPPSPLETHRMRFKRRLFAEEERSE